MLVNGIRRVQVEVKRDLRTGELALFRWTGLQLEQVVPPPPPPRVEDDEPIEPRFEDEPELVTEDAIIDPPIPGDSA